MSDPLGNFTITRGARLIASPRDCEIRLHLPPTMTGPPSVFDQPRRTYGYSCDTPPNSGSVGHERLGDIAVEPDRTPRSEQLEAVAESRSRP